MQLQLIRNATMRLTYGGRLLLTDPFLAAKHSLPSFAGISPNPLVDLPGPLEEIVAGVELLLVSHLHSDHFDAVAQARLSKDIPVLCQPGDEASIAKKGFHIVTPVIEPIDWRGVVIRRTPGRHGRGEWVERMGPVSGFVLQADQEPTVYWAGDTIWYEETERLVAELQPEVIITHSSGARFGEGEPIVMDGAQTIAVCQAAPWARVVAIHLESLDHGRVSRPELRRLAEAAGIGPEQLLIPADGETLTF